MQCTGAVVELGTGRTQIEDKAKQSKKEEGSDTVSEPSSYLKLFQDLDLLLGCFIEDCVALAAEWDAAGRP